MPKDNTREKIAYARHVLKSGTTQVADIQKAVKKKFGSGLDFRDLAEVYPKGGGGGKSPSGTKRKKMAEQVLDMMPDRRVTERTMSELLGGRGERRPVDVAQDLVYEAWESSDPGERADLAHQALATSPDCADAFNLLAETEARSVEEAADFYRQAVEAGERALGKRAFEESVGHFWGLLDTRPYMRARQGLAQCLQHTGDIEAAADHYQEMLRLNPDDNQGVRTELMACLLHLGREEELDDLLQAYDEDPFAAWYYTRVLLAFRRHGDSAETRKFLAEALEKNEHVPDYLLGRKKLPRRPPGYISLGDVTEAVSYVTDNQEVWRATPGALDWLPRATTRFL